MVTITAPEEKGEVSDVIAHSIKEVETAEPDEDQLIDSISPVEEISPLSFAGDCRAIAR